MSQIMLVKVTTKYNTWNTGRIWVSFTKTLLWQQKTVYFSSWDINNWICASSEKGIFPFNNSGSGIYFSQEILELNNILSDMISSN